ncbi:MAG: alginate export family protein [Pseudomonadota bacterium]
MKISRFIRRVCALGFLVMSAASVTAADEAVADETGNAIADALTGGTAGLKFRYRYEFVDQDGFADNANASTLLVRLNYETGTWRDWSGFLEFDHIVETLIKDYNSGAGTSGASRNRYPVVADPGGPDLNQLYLQYTPGDDVRVRLGRQRINLDDQRFVGGVGWRQNEQTYDSFSVGYDGWSNTSVFYSYVANVNRIFGSSVPAGSHEHNTHLLNVAVELNPDFKIVGYAYLIDNDDAAAFSTNTVGLRGTGGVALAGGRLNLLGEFARQSDAANAPAGYDANYYRLQGIWKRGGFTAAAGFESLGSDNGQGFRTPLATLHAFNGWADLFLGTPADGLEDLYLRVGYDLKPWALEVRYHDFGAEATSRDFGTEISLSAKRPLGERYALLIQLASFESDDAAAFDDTLKAWLMLTAMF